MLFARVKTVSPYSHLGKWGLSSSRVINQNTAMNHIADKWINEAYEKPKYVSKVSMMSNYVFFD